MATVITEGARVSARPDDTDVVASFLRVARQALDRTAIIDNGRSVSYAALAGRGRQSARR
jgi:hypothetical protein